MYRAHIKKVGNLWRVWLTMPKQPHVFTEANPDGYTNWRQAYTHAYYATSMANGLLN